MSRKTMNGADFLAAAKAAGKREKVACPGLAREVYARALSGAEVERISALAVKEGGDPGDPKAYDNARLILLTVGAAIVDARGKRLVPEGREHELPELPNAIYAALRDKALRVNGMAGDQESAGNA